MVANLSLEHFIPNILFNKWYIQSKQYLAGFYIFCFIRISDILFSLIGISFHFKLLNVTVRNLREHSDPNLHTWGTKNAKSKLLTNFNLIFDCHTLLNFY